MNGPAILPVKSPAQLDQFRELLREYVAVSGDTPRCTEFEDEFRNLARI